MKINIFLVARLIGLLILSSVVSKAQTVFVVTDSTDSYSAGTLRHAMLLADSTTGPSIIRFNISSPGTNPIDLKLDTLLSYLPLIQNRTVIIDGTTQPGYSPGNSRIRVIGALPPSTKFPTGFVFNSAPGSKLLGIRLWGFNIGVSIQFSDNCEVRNCNINRATDRTLELISSSYCIIKGNNINTDNTGTNLYPPPLTSYNATEGIIFYNDGHKGCRYNIIGGQGCDEGNTIAYTTSEGIDNYPSPPSLPGLNFGNVFSGNKIYGNANNAIDLRLSANKFIQPPIISASTSCLLSGTSATPFGIVEVFVADSGTTDRKSARLFLATTIANASGTWSANLGIVPGYAITATIRDPASNNTSELANAVPIIQSTLSVFNSSAGAPVCLDKEVTCGLTATNVCDAKIVWNFGDKSLLTENPIHVFRKGGPYTITAIVNSASGCASMTATTSVYIDSLCPPPCEGCIPSFAPDAGKYLISAWVKKETPLNTDTTYTTPKITVSFPPSATTTSFIANGRLIDGWQRVEGEFNVPSTGIDSIKIKLECLSGSGNCLFDDIRIFPFDASMKSYVYDPVTLKLVAELDERNYSTFYEYDEEGKLVRVKKETEKGIMTIKENRESSNKRQP